MQTTHHEHRVERIIALLAFGVRFGIDSTAGRAEPIPPARSVVAYVHDDSLYMRELPNGTARRVSIYLPCRRPRWSPSGRWLAFSQSGELWVVSRSGRQARRLSGEAEDFAWSSRSDTLTYYRDDGSLCIWNPRTRKEQLVQRFDLDPAAESPRARQERPLLQVSDGRLQPLSRSPDGRWFVYTHDDGVWRIRADGRRRKHLYQAPGTYFSQPVIVRWSPDGRRILFWMMEHHSSSANRDGSPLLDVSVQSGRVRSLAGRPPAREGEGGGGNWMLARADFLAFDPSGRRLTIAQGSSRFSIENKWITVIDYSSGRRKRLISRHKAFTCPAWSPDGRQLAYISAPDDKRIEWYSRYSRMRLSVMRADGTHRRALTKDDGYSDDSPKWLSDGRHIVFLRHDDAQKRSLWIIGVDGRGARTVADVDDEDYDWDADFLDVWTPAQHKQPDALPAKASIREGNSLP